MFAGIKYLLLMISQSLNANIDTRLIIADILLQNFMVAHILLDIFMNMNMLWPTNFKFPFNTLSSFVEEMFGVVGLNGHIHTHGAKSSLSYGVQLAPWKLTLTYTRRLITIRYLFRILSTSCLNSWRVILQETKYIPGKRSALQIANKW